MCIVVINDFSNVFYVVISVKIFDKKKKLKI